MHYAVTALGAAALALSPQVNGAVLRPARLSHPPSTSVMMTSSIGDDDLEEAVAALRRSYYRTDDGDDGGSSTTAIYNQHSSLHAQRAELLGMYSCLPAVFSNFPLLPQSQSVLDVWQRPDAFSATLEPFITLFETLLQAPPPWYFAHATVREAGRARTVGTLMRVANTKRTSDGRLQVLVQGLGRLRILNETRSTPFPQVDAQLIVDAEALLRSEVRVGAPSARDGARQANPGTREFERLYLTEALARERSWWAHDAPGFRDEDGRMPGVLLPFNSSVSVEAARALADEQAARRVADARDAWSEVGAAAAATDDEYTWDGVCQDWFMDVAAAQEEEAAAEQARCARVAMLEQRPPALEAAIDELREIGLERVDELEVACWLELDALLSRYAALNAALPEDAQRETPRVPKELLGLLPHAVPTCLGPQGTARSNWPDDFNLFAMMRLLDGSGEARVDPAYPAWRRATRLSFALADVLAQIHDAAPSEDDAGMRRPSAGREPSMTVAELLQEMLEAPSTSDRLRLALRRMREVRERL